MEPRIVARPGKQVSTCRKAASFLPLFAVLLALFTACSDVPTISPGTSSLRFFRSDVSVPLTVDGAVYQQLDNLYPIGVGSGSFLADDFIVPLGERWVLGEVGLTLVEVPLPLWPSYTLRFFAANEANPRIPGALIATRSFTHEETVVRDGLRILPISEPLVLYPGTYWIGISRYGTHVRTPPTGQGAVMDAGGGYAFLSDRLEEPMPADLAFALFGLTPAEQLQRLIALAGETPGVSNGSMNQLHKALNHLMVDETAQACMRLEMFVRDVRNHGGKKITEAAAAKLVEEGQAVQSAIGCS
ncbi:MAG TPA: hypothetical protein VGR37_18255 [Longimicrobiaceae bacterium]|nr:hypothetical protein [Longimicrobiaceae bacterium]